MGIVSKIAKPFATFIDVRVRKWTNRPVETQEAIFGYLMGKLAQTLYGKEHSISAHDKLSDFRAKIPVRDYEGHRPWIDRMVAGEKDVLWPGRPIYLSKTSGTTSGVKYIPITGESMPNHIRSARNALLNYIHKTGNAEFLDGKLIFLSGSPTLEKKNGILTGRLSGIVNHHVPGYLRTNQLPSWEINCIEDWEKKLDGIVAETLQQDMRLISGIPPWVQMYFDRITEKTGKPVGDVFPHFSLFVYGGVNFEPYRAKIEVSIGKKVDTLETYPASEGFIAYQDTPGDPGLLMLLNEGIFYEFIPLSEYFDENPTVLSIGEVKTGVNYAVIMSTNAGLWRYSIGDTVKFVSTNPYRIVVSGRVKHFISAFGEHVIGEEVEYAMNRACAKFDTEVIEFTVAPMVAQGNGQSRHQWLVEFGDRKPADLAAFVSELDNALQDKNIYYRDLITGNILQQLELIGLPKDSFIHYMKSKGRLGGQNKVPRLSNSRELADEILNLTKN